MLISKGNLKEGALAGQTAVVTGAGGGIGFEVARALLWLGANVVIAEIDKPSGREAQKLLEAEFGEGQAVFVGTDVGDEGSVQKLYKKAVRVFGQVDIAINNATVAPLGAVAALPISDWDASYRVNLRGPVLLARAFLPGMVERGYGVFVCVSSLGQEYMAAYEAMKAAQVHLGGTVDAEMEDSGVVAFTIGPGYVPTKTAEESIPMLAAMMGKDTDELFEIVKGYEISVEAAGAGFAAAVVLAERYRGQEISSTQALMDAGIAFDEEPEGETAPALGVAEMEKVLGLCRGVRETLEQQAAGWKERPIFEAQWMLRNFKKKAGMPVEEWLNSLAQLEEMLEKGDTGGIGRLRLPLEKLAGFYAYMHEMAKGYIKDPSQREEELGIVRGWQVEVEELAKLLK